MVRIDEAEGEVVRGGTSHECVMEPEKLSISPTLVCGRESHVIGRYAIAPHGPLEARGGGEP